MSQFNNNYDPSLDAVLYTTPECVKSGRNSQNTFVLQIRSYNGTPPKLEFFRQTPQGNRAKQSIRISFDEWQLVKKYAQEIDKLWTQYYTQQMSQQPQSQQHYPQQPQPFNQQPQQQFNQPQFNQQSRTPINASEMDEVPF